LSEIGRFDGFFNYTHATGILPFPNPLTVKSRFLIPIYEANIISTTTETVSTQMTQYANLETPSHHHHHHHHLTKVECP
jgi:hypothetical protein